MSIATSETALYVAPLWQGSSSVPRLAGLEAAGLKTITLDTSGWCDSPSRIVSSLAGRIYCTASVRAMNRSLLERAALHRPGVIWIDKGSWIYPATLRTLRKYTRLVVGHCTDDMFSGYTWLHRLGLRYYDAFLTTNRFNTVEIPRRYGVRTVRAGMGYDQDCLTPTGGAESPKRNDEQLIFVGHWEAHSEAYIRALQDAGVRVEVWGPLWEKARTPELRRVRRLPQPEYHPKLAEAGIALCFLSRMNRNESTGRSFEIPAAGALLLAERTPEHEFLYGDGAGAALFSNAEELVAKARYYLSHASERIQIAAAGQSRLLRLGLSWRDHVCREWKILEKILSGGALGAEDDAPFWPGFRQGRLPEQTKTAIATDEHG